MSRIVIDTSVLISALIGKAGPSREVVRQCLLGRHRALMSTALFLEYESVSYRQEILDRCPLSIEQIKDLLVSIYSVCELIQIHYLWRPNLRDEGDNFLVELAVAGNADVIITNNIRDLRGAELQFEGLKIQKPKDFLRS